MGEVVYVDFRRLMDEEEAIMCGKKVFWQIMEEDERGERKFRRAMGWLGFCALLLELAVLLNNLFF